MERFADWLWQRYRLRFVVAFAVVGILVTSAAIIVPCALGLIIVLDLEAGQAATFFVVGCTNVAVAIFGVLLSLREARRAVRAWSRGEGASPEAVWDALVTFALGFGLRAGAVLVLLQSGTMALLAHYADLGLLSYLTLEVLMVSVVALGVLLLGLALQVLVRPLLKEVAEELPDAHLPTVQAWSLRGRIVIAVLSTCFIAWVVGAGLGARTDSLGGRLQVSVLTGAVFAGYVTTIVHLGLVRPTLEPLRDLTGAIRKVRQGDYASRVPLLSADEFGDLAAALNEMQIGLRQREALHAAFGSYVDPLLAQRLVESGTAVFEGEDVEVTVFFADVRDFTTYAEGVTPAEAVERLNRLFDLIVPAVHDHGGHANHYLGDGLLAVFGAPQPLLHHADAAVAAAVEIQRCVSEGFGAELQLGIGVNTGSVIAGTVGGGGRHEFTVIGDVVNVAARVEQLTKETGDAILITDATRAALSAPRPRSTRRGAYDLRGKSEAVTVHAVASPRTRSPAPGSNSSTAFARRRLAERRQSDGPSPRGPAWGPDARPECDDGFAFTD